MITPAQFDDKVTEAVAELHQKVAHKTPAERLRVFAEHIDQIDEQLRSHTPVSATVTGSALAAMLEAEATELASVVRKMMLMLRKTGAVSDAN